MAKLFSAHHDEMGQQPLLALRTSSPRDLNDGNEGIDCVAGGKFFIA